MLVAITGAIGAGKSSLVEGIIHELVATPFFEPLPDSGNFMLEAYYKDPQRYAYSMQSLLLALRFQAHQEAQMRSNRGELCIMDSSIFSDQAFLEVQRECGYIDDYEYRAYVKLCECHYPYLQYPDLLIHLELPLDKEIERIEARKRECESGIPRGYLEALNRAYSDLIPWLSRLFPVRVIDATASKEEVLHTAIDLIDERRLELEEHKETWAVYKRNTGY